MNASRLRSVSPHRLFRRIAVEGCCHGQLDAIYKHIQQLEVKNKYKIDVLLICGDFQAVRNHQDLQCMAVPDKYKELGQFYKYYTRERQAPVLTIVIGGNHEASNYMWELYHGGWLAPNIYFLGHAGCVQVNGIRIAGASGIFKAHDFRQGNYEKMPYDSSAMRSIYHMREFCVRKLSLLSPTDIFLSHDWPQGIEHHGDLQGLLRRKRHFRSDVEAGTLGSPPLMSLLKTIKPRWWFAAHLHVRYEATVVHDGQPATPSEQRAHIPNPDEIVIDDDEEETPHAQTETATVPSARNPEEIVMDDEEGGVDVSSPVVQPSETRFLALDKCLPKRQFLEVIDFPAPQEDATQEPVFSFDPEWLAICRAFHPWFSTTRHQRPFPDEAEARQMVAKELEWVSNNVPKKTGDQYSVAGCQTFVPTAPGPDGKGKAKFEQPPWYTNPQTEAFCSMLELVNKVNPPPTLSAGPSS